MRKKAQLGQTLSSSALFLGALYAAVLGGTGFAAGYGLGKFTSPRDTDKANIQKQYRLARLQSDVQNAQVLQKQEDAARAAKENNIRKTVYGIV